MSKAPVMVLDYGVGNIHSIIKALRQYLPKVIYSAKPEDMAQARALILPGDGAFACAMHELEKNGQRQRLLDFAASGRPLLGICIGFQILFEDSEEGAGQSQGKRPQGLGLLKGHIERFSFSDDQSRIPHMGWNLLYYTQKYTQKEMQSIKEYMYFVHSYRAVRVPQDMVIAHCHYAGDVFPAIVQKENILAAQFHPEKSGNSGMAFLEKWARTSLEPVSKVGSKCHRRWHLNCFAHLYGVKVQVASATC